MYIYIERERERGREGGREGGRERDSLLVYVCLHVNPNGVDLNQHFYVDLLQLKISIKLSLLQDVNYDFI